MILFREAVKPLDLDLKFFRIFTVFFEALWHDAAQLQGSLDNISTKSGGLSRLEASTYESFVIKGHQSVIPQRYISLHSLSLHCFKKKKRPANIHASLVFTLKTLRG